MFLVGCRNTMEDIESLEEMDNPTNLRTVVSKLPYKMKERWRAEAYNIKERRDRRAKFTDLVSYIERQAKIATDPLFGDIPDSRPTSTGKNDKERPPAKKEKRGSFRRNVSAENQKTKGARENEVRLPEIEADVGLLIGANCSKAQWSHGHAINSRNGGPYAVKTAIGWVVNGPIRKELSEKEKPPHCSVNRITVTEIEKLLVQQYNTDFPERNYDDKEEMSQRQAVHAVGEEKRQPSNGHYSIGLPLRNHKLPMPKNRCMAEQRLASLRRKFRKDPGFYEDYKCFMDNVIEKATPSEFRMTS
ncbi:hypothetical protein AAFF_G00090220 [Aldrovandia affinis]|uniref:Uncharacterized protein n=1 Tax=Aldrovandia affinis TaxID=143900 RepID=A0AAD7WBW3_9TELE|nr:hypothetical protein AAFF_G00090220 [Aldrovandia affinis]